MSFGIIRSADGPTKVFADKKVIWILAAAAVLLTGAVLTGIPASTTHGKTAALMGSAAARRMRAVNWRVAGEMAWAWVLTFPGCAAAGYIAARIFLRMG